MGGELDLVLVDREVRHAAPELEQLLARITVAHVLLHRARNGLLGEAVLQLEGGQRQAVDEQRQVQRQLRLVAAVAELAGDAEAIGGIPLRRPSVAGRGAAVEEVDGNWPVLDPVA